MVPAALISHRTTCHRPSTVSPSLLTTESPPGPRKRHLTRPVTPSNSTFHMPPTVVDWPFWIMFRPV